MAKYAIASSGKPLTEQLSPDARAKLVKILGDSGVPAAALDKMKGMGRNGPWPGG